MSFDLEITNGVFSIPECTVCKKIIWPPAEFCSYCLGKVSLKKGDFQGKIIEFSRHDEEYCFVGGHRPRVDVVV